MSNDTTFAPPPALSKNQRTALRRALLGWYRANHRKLPWRAEPGQLALPYLVLVSEAMLQQTQVDRVVGSFERFIEALPTLADLADADEQQVLSLWQGLGYYRRARHLHAAARAIVRDHGGQVPREARALAKLPGVGRYTAGAIASLAFGRPEPVVDGNVKRVLARVFEMDQPIDLPAAERWFWEAAGDLLARRDAGTWNQAVMELGATVCTPAGPRCDACPVARFCRARTTGRVDQLPVPAKRAKVRAVHHAGLAIEHDGKVLLTRRPSDGLWSNMWQLPTLEAHDKHARPATAAGITRWADRTLGIRIAKPTLMTRLIHQTTHRRIHFALWHTRLGKLEAAPPDALPSAVTHPSQWRTLDDVGDLPISNVQRRMLALLREGSARR